MNPCTNKQRECVHGCPIVQEWCRKQQEREQKIIEHKEYKHKKDFLAYLKSYYSYICLPSAKIITWEYLKNPTYSMHTTNHETHEDLNQLFRRLSDGLRVFATQNSFEHSAKRTHQKGICLSGIFYYNEITRELQILDYDNARLITLLAEDPARMTWTYNPELIGFYESLTNILEKNLKETCLPKRPNRFYNLVCRWFK